ncbi:hypothetical protein TNCV_2170241 [Trichonephila clavipes]|nr:hypothetical protein TNCV_2170241 [Trichonephila clavipes]
MPENDDVNVENTKQTSKISHSEGLKIVEIACQYFEQHRASVMVLLFLRRLRNEAEKMQKTVRKETGYYAFLKQKNNNNNNSQFVLRYSTPFETVILQKRING